MDGRSVKVVRIEGMGNASANKTARGKLKARKMDESAALYVEQLERRGCAGICALYDSCSCEGGKCDSCGVCKAGICARRVLLSRRYPQVREPDGGDYRCISGDKLYVKRQKDNNFDLDMRMATDKRVMTKKSLEDILREYRLLGKRKNLAFDWKDLSILDIINMYPNNNWRASRIEVQMGIYVWMNYRNDIDIRHMAERFCIPVSVANKLFKDYYGVSFSMFLHGVKSGAAKRLLLIDNLRISEISEILGYKTCFHFSVNFKRVEGISPNYYRNLYIKQKGKISERELQNVIDLSVELFEKCAEN